MDLMMMMQRPHVPEFGAWDDGLTYTAVFDEARAAKGGKMINPNDPAENPDLAAILYGKPASAPPPPQGSDEPHGRNMANVKDHEQGIVCHMYVNMKNNQFICDLLSSEVFVGSFYLVLFLLLIRIMFSKLGCIHKSMMKH